MSNDCTLITGANGRLGQLLSKQFKLTGKAVIEVSRTAANPEFRVDLTQDAQSLTELIKKYKPQTVFHTAAIIGGTDQALQYETNVQMILNLCEAIGLSGNAEHTTLVNLSSAAELGAVHDTIAFVDENYPSHPVSMYGVSKLAQTDLALAMGRRFGFRAICARIFNVLGLPRSDGQPVQSWVNKILAMKGKPGPHVLRTGNLEIIRDFLDAETIAEILILLSESPKASGIVNVGSGQAIVLRDVLQLLKELSGVDFEVQRDPTFSGTGDIKRVVASTHQLKKLLGQDIEFDLRKTLLKMLEAGASHV